MYRSFLRLLQVLFILLDLAALNVSFLLAQSTYEESIQSHYYLRYLQFLIMTNAFWLLSAWIGKVYTTKYITFFDGFIKATLRAFAVWAIINVIYLVLPRRVELSKGLVYSTMSLFFIAIPLTRLIYLGLKEWVRRYVDLKRRVLIIGYNRLSQNLVQYLDSDALGVKIMGYIDDSPKSDDVPKLPLYTNTDDTLRLAKQLRVNEVYCTIMPESNSKLYTLMQQADKELIRFKIIPDLYNLINRPVHVSYIRELPVLSIREEPLEILLNRFVKRSFDIIVSTLVAIFILSWLIPLLGLLIKMESRGPIFFVQLRSGMNNRPFRCYKFRSMGANNDTEATQATKNDKRVTRIGRILRKTSLDEFPQFLNVLKGEMSIVGPRPHMLKHTKSFSGVADDYMIRQFLKPGITGWAQVNGYRGEIKEPIYIKKRVEYDLWYLENWSLWLDIRIIFLTVYNAVKGEENAY